MVELLSAGYKTERGFMKKGEIYEGIIEKVEFPNKGFVWVDDQKVIVKNGIPGQKVRFMINKKRSGRAEGRLLEVLEKSPLETREPACQEFPACGGCMPTGVRHASTACGIRASMPCCASTTPCGWAPAVGSSVCKRAVSCPIRCSRRWPAT